MARKKLSEKKVWWKNVKDSEHLSFRVLFGRNMCDPVKEPYEFESLKEFEQAMEHWNIDPEGSGYAMYRTYAVIKNISTEDALKYELSEKKRMDSEYKQAIQEAKK